MFKLDPERVIALGAAIFLLLGCAVGPAFSIRERAYALQELAERSDMLSRLQAHAHQNSGPSDQLVTGRAPAAAFLNAQTPGLASAQLQTYFAHLVSEQQATLISSAVEPASQDDLIRMQASLEFDLKSLQAVLYQAETGTPYVFVEALRIQPSTATQRVTDDVALRSTVDLRALWRREP